MTSVTREELMLYCREDDQERGNLCCALAEAAEEKLTNLGVVLCADNKATYALVVKALTLHWLDNPTLREVPEGLQQMLNSMKHEKGGI